MPLTYHNALYTSLETMGLLKPDERPVLHRMTGGVSSEVYRVDIGGRTLCVKRALPKLQVEKDWHAPVERSRYEAAWMRLANSILPGIAPDLVADDPVGLVIAMAYLPPADYPLWKDQLRTGIADAAVAASVGQSLAVLHGATAYDRDIERQFEGTDVFFHALRIDAYLLEAARVQPSVAEPLRAIVERTSKARIALVHGDFSPKNMLIGPDGPVILDSETATYADPAFDLAFCLNHLLLKCVWHPVWTRDYLDCFGALAERYLAEVTWEPQVEIESRTAALLSGLLLARVDGKSPVEYVTDPALQDNIRQRAMAWLHNIPANLSDMRRQWCAMWAEDKGN